VPQPADAATKPPTVQPRANPREFQAATTVTAAAARGSRPAPEGGEQGSGSPDSPSFLASSAAPGVRWWWVALPASGLLVFIILSLYAIKEGGGSAVNNTTLASSNINRNMNGPFAAPTPAADTRAIVSASPAQLTPAATPGLMQRPAARADESPAAGGDIPVNVNRSEPSPTPRPIPPQRTVVSGGVLNGKAVSKPPPAYPPIAKAARASGTVTVQVLVDESGRVISASAVSGHPLLQQAAVAAARQARFSPTLLSGQPVKVSGVVTYNFVLQ
jgi:TonB family protein